MLLYEPQTMTKVIQEINGDLIEFSWGLNVHYIIVNDTCRKFNIGMNLMNPSVYMFIIFNY